MSTWRKRILLAACAMAILAAPAALSEEGWINLFDQETLYGWNTLGSLKWDVADGAMACPHRKGACGWIATTSQFADFELVAKVRVLNEGTMAIVVRAGLEGHPSENGAALVPVSGFSKRKPAAKEICITAKGDSVTATIDGKAVDVQGGGRACGYIGMLYTNSGKVEVEEVKVRPLNMKPIFNGKDLDGWNIIPGRASKFSVIDGALNIKDGNGQIETAGIYKDFILQLSIFSNGDHLNSGVFYRGEVGEFWRGYESQVRNEWQKDDRTRPVDFGTGGNYANQNARKVVSTDREWFEKTIVCQGNHMAVWINGYLVSDWFDMRSISPNNDGKNGYVPGPGTIHLQGHDPTTDLSFKNIRIQALGEK